MLPVKLNETGKYTVIHSDDIMHVVIEGLTVREQCVICHLSHTYQ